MFKPITTIAAIAFATTMTTSGIAYAGADFILAAHKQYVRAITKGHAGNRSSYLERAGLTKGDDYQNCINKGFWESRKPNVYEDFNSHDFCAWHAEIGKWQFRG